MRKIKVTINTGFCRGIHETIIEVEDDATEEEIEGYVDDLVWEYISVGWEEVK